MPDHFKGPRVQSINIQGTVLEIDFRDVVDVAAQAFYDLHIEDMWLPFFCNTTNINTSQMDIHETGYAWRFISECFHDIQMFKLTAMS
jgi:predicted acylesterase/phospholipase RssA